MSVFLEPTVQKFWDGLVATNPPSWQSLGPVKARKALDDLQSSGNIASEVSTTEHSLSTSVGSVPIRLYRPKRVTEPLPTVLYCHGGGWVLGDALTHQRLISDLTIATGFAFVFVNYTSSPDAKYPVPIEQSYAVLTYIAQNGSSEFNLDTTKLAVAGDSAGGNMATVIAILAKERSGPHLKSQILFYPATDANFETASYNQFNDNLNLTKSAMHWFWDNYAPDVTKRKDYHVTPLNASLSVLKDLPPALVITAENDVLREEGESYAKKLLAAGNEVVPIRLLGTLHDFAMLNGISHSYSTKCGIELAARELKKRLG